MACPLSANATRAVAESRIFRSVMVMAPSSYTPGPPRVACWSAHAQDHAVLSSRQPDRQEICMSSVIERRLVAVVVLLASASVGAHHGTNASYDSTTAVTLTGVVTRFTFRNSHAFVEFDVRNDRGEMVHWVGEMNSPTVLRDAGWTATTIK